jgi:hypothetical protein
LSGGSLVKNNYTTESTECFFCQPTKYIYLFLILIFPRKLSTSVS